MLQEVDRLKKAAGKTAPRVTLAQVGQVKPARVPVNGPAVTFAAPTLPPKQTPALVTPALRRKRRYTPRVRRCAFCNESFLPGRKTARYCCPAHRQAAYRRRQQRRRPAPPAAPELRASTCIHCQRGYFSDLAHPSLYCSTRCKNACWRSRRAAAVDAIAGLFALPYSAAQDRVEYAGLARITAQLAAVGWYYDSARREFRKEAS